MEKSQQMKYSSSSRTDKGVSTCGLVVSLKLRMCDNAKDLINQHLPPDIRVLDLRKATRSFHAKSYVDQRTYSYTMPTFAFDTNVSTDDISTYRIDEEKLKSVRSYLYRYKGTHSFHNFTSGKRMGESSAKRYILDFWAETPFVHESVEFITLKVKGQSFMIHQIRKMIGLVIVLVSGRAPEQHYVRAFSEPLEDIPKAPGIGLLLEQVHYDSYNKKHDNMLNWSSEDEQKEFMKTHILPIIFKEELENQSMLKWIESLSNHDFTGEKAKEQWNEFISQKQKKEKHLNGNKSPVTAADNTILSDDKNSSNIDNGSDSPQPAKKQKLDEEHTT
uniref:tRNA pseudouridine synthase A-like isoform X1 n=2 Tax=Styela clava TaxID=7725 RepID=UPI00193A5D26|nr:tRNA pseudouridine synthase A-like isoform X1 [Styela clava]